MESTQDGEQGAFRTVDGNSGAEIILGPHADSSFPGPVPDGR